MNERRYDGIVSLCLGCFLLLGTLAEGALPKGWQAAGKARKSHGNYVLRVRQRDAVELLVETKKTHRQALLSVSDKAVSGYELKGDRRIPLRERVSYEARSASSASMDILVKVRDFDWSVYVDGRLRKVFASPFVLPGTFALRQDQAARVSGKGKFLAVPAARFVTNFMIEPGAKDELYPWQIQTGRWHLHTALEQSRIRPETSQGDLKRAPPTADKSPNFYSLKGGGKNEDCIITTGYEVYDDYMMTGSIQLTTGEAGLIVHHRDEIVPEGQKSTPAKAEFYAFTLRRNVPEKGMADVRLWRQEDGRRQVLARASVPLYANQWTLPGIAAHGDEIICYVDNWEVFRYRAPLTVGGKFGLYAKSPEEIRMDDVTVKPFEDIQLETVSGLRFQAEAIQGTVTAGGKDVMKADGKTPAVVNLGGKARSSILLGRPHVQGGVFSVRVRPQGKAWKLGLVAGWQDATHIGYEYSVERKGETEHHVLKDAHGKVLETLTLPTSETPEFDLMADASSDGLLRFLKGGKVMVIRDIPKTFSGCMGITAAAGTQVVCSHFELADSRSEFKELEQKNPIFKKDSFMRHWASPEGQWIAGKGGAMWHKGDFFGDFYLRMPCIPGSKVRLGVADDKLEGPLAIIIQGKELVLCMDKPLQKAAVVRRIALTPPQGKGVDALNYELHHEGRCLWIDVAGKRVAYEHLQADLRQSGTRVCSLGLNLTHLARTKVTRSNVIDEFFNESPFMWTANGGDWQIINRFQCTPSWSHMIAQSLDNMGAFWRKQIFKGDMTLEFYAGTRHGYYDKMGNLNCTIMAQTTTPSSGYTATATEWDQNLSQNWSRLYKNGKKLKETDSYLVPRRRKGMYRRIMNPLISSGRPYHGAWYYIKLRKIGTKLEYYFDDELVYSTQDPQMIQEGLVGIWTFMHSMTLAQIKITYDEVRPRPVPVKQLPLTETVPAKPKALTYASMVNGWPADSLSVGRWKVQDTVGQSILRTIKTKMGTGQMLENKLGSGSMTMTGSLPVLPLDETAGWTCLVKRTEKARFNAFYEILDKNHKVQHRVFHRLSGDDFSYGKWKKAGESKLGGKVVISAEDRDWTRITIWIPTSLRNANDQKQGRKVRFGGFGVEQQDALMNGIGGNGPGEAYAVAGLSVIRYDAPQVTAGEGETLRGFADAEGKRPVSGTTAAEIAKALAATGKTGLNRALLEVTKQGQVLRQEVCWLREDAEAPVSLDWDESQGDCLRLSLEAPYPHRGFVRPAVNAGKVRLKPYEHRRGDDFGKESILFLLPRKGALPEKLTLTVRLSKSKKHLTVSRSLADLKRLNLGPVLLGFKGLTPCFHGFEADGKGRNIRLGGISGRYQETRNSRLGQRLQTRFKSGFSVAQYPVAQFQYRASDMAYVTLQFDQHEGAFARLTRQDGGWAPKVRLGTYWNLDDSWYAWQGIVADAFVADELRMGKFLKNSFCFRSVDGIDQTGRYSSLALDNLVFGPAVREDKQLEFVPNYMDVDGVKKVQVVRITGAVSYWNLSESQRQALVWVTYQPGERIKPSLNGLADGIHHLALRAIDNRGKVGDIVDIPFMVDRKPLKFSHTIVKSDRPLDNGQLLQVTVNVGGGAPWCSDKATFHIGKGAKAENLDGWQSNYIHGSDSAVLKLNYPFLFRELLNESKNGDVLELGIDGIIDGAGNRTPRVSIPIKVDYASDKRGPSWYSMRLPSSIAAVYNWDGRVGNPSHTAASHNEVRIQYASNQSPYLQHLTYYSTGTVTIKGLSWKPFRHAYLALRAWRNIIRPNTKVTLVLTFEKPINGQKDYLISLTSPSQGKADLNRTQTFKWEAKTWHAFLFDIPDLMSKAGLQPKDIESAVIKHIGIVRQGASHRDELRLDDIVIFGVPEQPSKPEILTWTAYDASGIASLEAECIDELGKRLFIHSFKSAHQADLHQLRMRFKGIKWIKWYAKDKAGNPSVPFWMPVKGQ